MKAETSVLRCFMSRSLNRSSAASLIESCGRIILRNHCASACNPVRCTPACEHDCDKCGSREREQRYDGAQ